MAMELDATGLGPVGGERADDQQVTLVAETTRGAPPSGTPQTTTIELDAAGGAVHLPAGTDTSHPVQVGNDLEFIQPDGSIILIPNGAVAGLVVFVGDVEIPADAVAALFSANNITPAEGGQGGAGGAHGNFNDPGPQGIGQSFTVSDLLAPSSLSFDAGTGEDTPQNTPPIFRGPITALVAEEAFPGGNEDTDGNTDTLGALTVYHGNMGGFDADGNPLLYSLTPPPSGSLSSDGFPVDNWVGSGTGDLTGYNSHGDKVLNISIDNATGDFTVTLFQAVDHPNDTTTVTPEDALSIVFGATVQDVPAGATAHTTLTLTIEDDSAIIVPSAAGPNLIENGDFQFGFTLNGNIWGTGSGEATGTVPGWTIVQTDNSGPNVLERIGADFPDDGLTPSTSYMVDLEATYGNIVISQTVAGVTEGQPYTLKFEAGSPSYAPTGSTILEVYFNGDLVDRIDPTHAMQTYTYTVVGGAGPNTLSFKEVGEPQEGYGTYLANISLQTSNAFIVDEDALGGGNPGGDGDVVAGAMTTGSLNISWGADNFNNVIDGGINGSPANGDRSVTFATDVVSTLEPESILARHRSRLRGQPERHAADCLPHRGWSLFRRQRKRDRSRKCGGVHRRAVGPELRLVQVHAARHDRPFDDLDRGQPEPRSRFRRDGFRPGSDQRQLHRRHQRRHAGGDGRDRYRYRGRR